MLFASNQTQSNSTVAARLVFTKAIYAKSTIEFQLTVEIRRLHSESGSRFFLCQEIGDRTDRLQLVLAQAVQLVLVESVFVQKSPEHLRELRIAIVVLAVDLFTTLGQVVFQILQIRRPLDRVRHLLCSLNHFVKLPTQSSVESCAGDGFF